ncbi:MAG TPA: hypothetical protein DCR78_21800 [Pseudomonas sp.]|jgi:hypothetical protein|uniref:Uncharacterized protein n=3 Tax=Stutzerimonas TaxID=2901164 RepID=A0A5S5BH11_STUST|nr:hypothetical protein [Gammaproteobacteria bacterium]TYP66279.1 hypothetical protein A9A72_121277 [Stutzerimonas stutzeri]HAQ89053.1 hypothetical protein [Pseudomonas sp.]MBU0852716.1 hypothetical protein [Gammaproteobacteria bacterium]MBU1303862.1 hypothetical protein [Gammaproteobacteria bacterium]|tara:strand:- start:262 stop:990 length:729 start_codon:yes stop_codon:yes gene_type:complete
MRTFMNIDADTVSHVAGELNRTGFASISDYLTPEQLEAAREDIACEARFRGNASFAVRGTPNITGTLFERLVVSEEFQRLLLGVFTAGTGRTPLPTEKVHTVMRCLKGCDSARESNRFHYDATTLTVLLPVSMPECSTEQGRLVLFPNTRGLRFSALFNVIEKAVIQNRISQRLVAVAVRLGFLHPVKVVLAPGSLYFFWGYRSLHANEPCDPQALRSTVLFHYDNPHRHSQVARLLLPKGR